MTDAANKRRRCESRVQDAEARRKSFAKSAICGRVFHAADAESPACAVMMDSSTIRRHLEHAMQGARELDTAAALDALPLAAGVLSSRSSRVSSTQMITIAEARMILGVSPTASADEIKRAHRRQVKRHHPDIISGDAAKFYQVQRAYEALTDQHASAAYPSHRARERAAWATSTRFTSGFAGCTNAEMNGYIRLWSEVVIGLGDEMAEAKKCSDSITAQHHSALKPEYDRQSKELHRLKQSLRRIARPFRDGGAFVADYLAIQNTRLPEHEREAALRRLAAHFGRAGSGGAPVLAALLDSIIRAEQPKERREGSILDEHGKPVGAPPARERGIGTPEFHQWLRNTFLRELRQTDDPETSEEHQFVTEEEMEKLIALADPSLPARAVAEKTDYTLPDKVVPVDLFRQLQPDDLAAISQALDYLDGEGRTVVLAILRDGMSVEQVQAKTGMSRAAVYRAVDRIERRLRDR